MSQHWFAQCTLGMEGALSTDEKDRPYIGVEHVQALARSHGSHVVMTRDAAMGYDDQQTPGCHWCVATFDGIEQVVRTLREHWCSRRELGMVGQGREDDTVRGGMVLCVGASGALLQALRQALGAAGVHAVIVAIHIVRGHADECGSEAALAMHAVHTLGTRAVRGATELGLASGPMWFLQGRGRGAKRRAPAFILAIRLGTEGGTPGRLRHPG